MIDLSRFERSENIYIISTPQHFAGGELAYQQAVAKPDREMLLQGQGAVAVLTALAQRKIESILEIGSGPGGCSIGMVSAAPQANILITDTSKQFLSMIPPKLTSFDAGANCQFATLAGEDIGRLTKDSFDAIVVASSVHHISEWRRFIAGARPILRKGGVLLIQEPMREGCFLMAAILDAALSSCWVGLDQLTEQDRTEPD